MIPASTRDISAGLTAVVIFWSIASHHLVDAVAKAARPAREISSQSPPLRSDGPTR